MEKFGIKGNKLERIVAILKMLYKGKRFSINAFAAEFDVNPRTIEKDIKFMKEQNIIKFVGARKTGKYLLTEKGRKMIEEIEVKKS